MKWKTIIPFVVFIVIAQGAGLLGSLATMPAIPGWYQTLQKPIFNPPSWIFGPVWTILYIMMGVAAALIYQKGISHVRVKRALIFFCIQLVLNSLWSILFFGFRNPAAAYVEILFLWVMILLTTNKFFHLSKPAGWLMVPYLLWVTFASILNLSIVTLN